MTLKDRYKEFGKGCIYHIYNRGVAKGDIFLDDKDYYGYLNRLKKFLTTDWKILCYALMPNHVHLVIKQENDTPISDYIRSLHTSYVYYFNRKYKRVGPLFQDRFKARLVESDEYLLHLSRYIHLNPLISKYAKNTTDYKWTSYLDYIGKYPGTLCSKDLIYCILANDINNYSDRGLSPTEKYERFVEEGIKYLQDLKYAKEVAKIVENCW